MRGRVMSQPLRDRTAAILVAIGFEQIELTKPRDALEQGGDLKNTGARWADEPVVTDGRLVSSRKPDGIPAFIRKTIEVFADACGEAARAA